MNDTEGFPMSFCAGIFLLIDAQPADPPGHSWAPFRLIFEPPGPSASSFPATPRFNISIAFS